MPAQPKVTLIRPSAGINHSGGGEAFAIEMSRQLFSLFEVELLAGRCSCVESYPLQGFSRSEIHRFAQHPPFTALLNQCMNENESGVALAGKGTSAHLR